MRIATWVSACCVVALLGTPLARAHDRAFPRVHLDAGETPLENESIEGNQELLLAHRALEIATAVSLAATAVLGSFQAYNLPTLFGDGACGGHHHAGADETVAMYDAPQTDADHGDPIFGDYGCRDALSVVHGVLGFTTVILFTSEEIVGMFAPDPDHGDDVAVETFAWISRIGLALTLVAGVIGANPYNMLSIDDEGTEYDFGRTMRTVHMGLAVVSSTAYLGKVAFDLF